ncbi:hypothetical protein [Alteromonas mediterranea]|uniref:Uncharacterized protein n=1 Tax=Alteromonas mediterranea (strain DSM 17117 / CIP 110805 / LMG 28347 / Deep ecotype) TaxID=1774373 RepID=F2GCA2_ALTMD|nr:hypothetical protein [Alteromonas mediterranea]AEA99058.1 hypothetical protein MADE_1014620 [Alteromonas mediterranea DE]
MILLDPNNKQYENTSIKPSTTLGAGVSFAAVIMEKADFEQLLSATPERCIDMLQNLRVRLKA